MGDIGMRVRALRDRFTKRRDASGDRALKRKEAAARRLEHERLDQQDPALADDGRSIGENQPELRVPP